MKGTAKTITNVKPMAGGATLYQMQVGDYAYGTVAGSDLINFTHFYHKSGDKVELQTLHKAYGLTFSNEAEVTPPPPVDPPPTTPVFPDYYILESPTGERKRYNKDA